MAASLIKLKIGQLANPRFLLRILNNRKSAAQIWILFYYLKLFHM